MTEREKIYVKAVIAAYRVHEVEIRAAHRLLKKKSVTDYMFAKVAADQKHNAAEMVAWGIYLATPHTSRPGGGQ